MARTVSVPCPPAPVLIAGLAKARDDRFPGLLSRTFAIDVITPLFGGGAVAGETDAVALVRASSIRGHLRFWWRATKGLAFPTTPELREEEAKVWGAASKASPVIVEVSLRDAGHDARAEDLRRDRDIAYCVFPFQENKHENRPARVGRQGVKFDLTLRYPPALAPDVLPALWAWINFGGIGARTRRGLGALRAGPPFVPSPDREGKWFAQQWQTTWKLPPSDVRPWPVLSGSPIISAPLPDAHQAWAKALRQLREFRQGYGIGRRGDPARPGRSFWPEADSLRMITGRGLSAHMDSLTVDEPAFPRTALGMPIVMHFKDREDQANDCILEPAEPDLETSRMSSPIIVRPLAVGGGKYVAMVLRLLARKPSGVSVAKFGRRGDVTEVERPELATYPGSPMKGTDGSALDAFMAFARKNL